jgi:prolyl-tRNA synthetase
LASITDTIPEILEQCQAALFNKAKESRDKHLVQLETWDKFVETLNKKCIIMAPWCEEVACEEQVKERSARP